MKGTIDRSVARTVGRNNNVRSRGLKAAFGNGHVIQHLATDKRRETEVCVSKRAVDEERFPQAPLANCFTTR